MSEGFDIAGRIYVAGHRGLVGSALVRHLQKEGAAHLILRSHAELDLTDQANVERFFAEEQPEYVFLAAAKVGGIRANSMYPAEFIRDNLAIQTNVIHSAWRHGTKKLLFLGSSCIYPRLAPQPIREDALLTGPLEPTNEWYAIAKIAGIKMCQAYRRQYGFHTVCAMPTNLFGPGDTFDLEKSHVIPALIHRFHTATTRGDRRIILWGTGSAMREFLYVDDLASAAVVLMREYDRTAIVNVGSGEEISIAALAAMVSEIAGYTGEVVFDMTRPDGTPRKKLDASRLQALGWRPTTSLHEGLGRVYQDYLQSTPQSLTD